MKGLLFALAALVPATASAQRPPEPGCHWRPLEGLGLRLQVQDCAAPDAHYVFSVNRDWIEQHRPADDTTFGSHRIIRALTKPAELPIETAIMRFARPTFPPGAHNACEVTRVRPSPVKAPGKIALTLTPTGAYARKINKELEAEPRDFGCGEYGAGQGLSYFEYHPSESRTRFLFVVYGQDAPLFDEQSIQIGTTP